MLKLTSDEIRESYLKFFESKGHLRLPSFSLVPVGDPTLLIIGAGMAPFKAYFKGEAKPPRTRITTCQKCIRAEDIENVGRTARHHTFFEMLGNFSFGDYFKKETCEWAWEFLTKVLGLPAEKMYVSIHTNDDEAEEIWINHVGVPKERIVRLDSNFWGPIGLTGPCGPCSEIMIDQGEEFGCDSPDCGPGCDCDRYFEIWNLVFPGLNKNEKGVFENLPAPGIDTGLGFERLTAYMQGKKNNFETDLFMPLLNKIEDISGLKLGENEKNDISMKVIADHMRAVIFMACDGITPSNEGRGYVMRRLLRRCVRLSKDLNFGENSLTLMIEPLVNKMGHIYPELIEKREYCHNIISLEEENFGKTLSQGMALLENLISKLQAAGEDTLSGKNMFSLYDTYGFPKELTEEIAAEKGIKTDIKGFEEALEEQRKRARAAQAKKTGGSGVEIDLTGCKSVFTGYTSLSEETTVTAIFADGKKTDEAGEGTTADVVFENTCFYGESGGQVGDTGSFATGTASGNVTDTRKTPSEINLHRITVEKGTLKTGDKVKIEVNTERRKAIMRHHSATHLLQAALRKVLGGHVSQMGSMVDENRLRFDFAHHCALTHEEVEQVEKTVNGMIMENVPVSMNELPIKEALNRGALAFFGEKYGEKVRLVEMEGLSAELCGGTHIKRTGDIGAFKITIESAIGMGSRRIEAACGFVAIERFQKEERVLKEVSTEFAVDFEALPHAIARLKDNLKNAEKELQEARFRTLVNSVDQYISSARQVDEIKVVTSILKDVSRDELLSMTDLIGDKIKPGIAVLGAVIEGKVAIIVKVSDDLLKQGMSAVPLIKEIAKTVGGSGGGKPALGQAGGKEPEKLPEAISKAFNIVKDEIEKMKVKN
ncbi:MAG: alanine--tRNA ligase [Firmicutes bacterium]|nr:alanine--tRNA ligase [Bacillota bacterium]